MRRIIALSAALVALCVTLTGCGPITPNAATVNGTSISRKSLLSDAEAFAALEGDPFELQLTTGDTVPGDTVPADTIAYRPAGIANLLFKKITDVLVADAAEKYGVSTTQDDIEQLKSGGLGPYAALPKNKLDELVQRAALQNKLLDYLTTNQWWTDDDVAKYYDLVKDVMFDQACVRHILVATEDEANQVMADLKAGGDFAGIAAAKSTDTSNKDQGGDLGCNPRGTFVKEFEDAVAAAKDGDLVGPVKSEFGYHVISVTSTYHLQSFDEAKAAIVSRFGDGQAQGWVDYVLRSAKISVDPRYGTWNDEVFDIDLPQGAQSTTPNVVNPGK
jgi:foldase protein PrsA